MLLNAIWSCLQFCKFCKCTAVAFLCVCGCVCVCLCCRRESLRHAPTVNAVMSRHLREVGQWLLALTPSPQGRDSWTFCNKSLPLTHLEGRWIRRASAGQECGEANITALPGERLGPGEEWFQIQEDLCWDCSLGPSLVADARDLGPLRASGSHRAQGFTAHHGSRL